MNISSKIHPAVSMVGAEWLYVMSDLKFWRVLPVFKAGITGQTPDQRRKEIQDSILQVTGQKVHIYICCAVPVWGVKKVEKAMHIAFDRFRSDVFAGTSGGTEWFAFRNVISSMAVFLMAFGNALPVSHCLAFSMLFVGSQFPFDAVICALLLWLIQTAFVMAAVFGLLYVGWYAL